MRRQLTDVDVRVSGPKVDQSLEGYVRRSLAFQAGEYAPWIKKLLVHFEGGECRAKVLLLGVSGLELQVSDPDPRQAFDRLAVELAERVRLSLYPEVQVVRQKPRPRGRRALPLPLNGSLIGRRVGRARANLDLALDRPEKRKRNQPVDTARPGVSASDRRAGGSSTARRNSQRKNPKATSALEDSAGRKPSRKETRRSANRVKHAGKLQLRQIVSMHAPSARAGRGARLRLQH